MNSNEYVWHENDEREIGLLFIDGGHEYEEVRADWENFTPAVVAGGYVLVHDYIPVGCPDDADYSETGDNDWSKGGFPGVIKFIQEDVAATIIDRGGSIAVFQKEE